jgi:ribosome-associated translation inhibitor RaiA
LNLNIRTDGIKLNEGLKGKVESHLHFVLSRYDDLIEVVDVLLKDRLTTVEGDAEKSCLITVRLLNSRLIVVQGTDTDINGAITYCVQKMNRNFKSYLCKYQLFNRQSSRKAKMKRELALG